MSSRDNLPDSPRPSVSVIIPAHNGANYLRNCLANLTSPTFQSFELIVVDDDSTDTTGDIAAEFGAQVVTTVRRSGPAAARNLGAQLAQGEYLVFLDADVCVQPDTVTRLVNVLMEETEVAAVFGSYDASPAAGNLVSQFRNLLHHYVHQTASPNATTFWAGCGAIRKSVFLALKGFDTRFQNSSVEDIEFGSRMQQSGYQIRLDRQTQVTHAKPWSLWSMLSCDLWSRGVPWARLILRQRAFPNDLNLKHAHRFSVLFACLCAVALSTAVWHSPWVAFLPLLGLVVIAAADTWAGKTDNPDVAYGFAVTLVLVDAAIAWRFSSWAATSLVFAAIVASLNVNFLAQMCNLRGLLFGILCVPLLLVHYLTCGIAFTCGIGLHFVDLLERRFGVRILSTVGTPASSYASPQPLSVPRSEICVSSASDVYGSQSADDRKQTAEDEV